MYVRNVVEVVPACLSAWRKLKFINKLYILPTTLLAWGGNDRGEFEQGGNIQGEKGWGEYPGGMTGGNGRGEMSRGKCPAPVCPTRVVSRNGEPRALTFGRK